MDKFCPAGDDGLGSLLLILDTKVLPSNVLGLFTYVEFRDFAEAIAQFSVQNYVFSKLSVGDSQFRSMYVDAVSYAQNRTMSAEQQAAVIHAGEILYRWLTHSLTLLDQPIKIFLLNERNKVEIYYNGDACWRERQAGADPEGYIDAHPILWLFKVVDDSITGQLKLYIKTVDDQYANDMYGDYVTNRMTPVQPWSF